MEATREFDMLVIGAGFAGLRTLHTMRDLGLSVAVLEAGEGIGGVWYWNRYPGARCDVESYDYSYSFSEALEQEWRWTERYASQPEILAYIDHVAERFDLRRDVHLRQRMTRAVFDEEAGRWSVTTDAGDEWSGRYLVMAVGNLSETKAPEFPGRHEFRGDVHHSARWPTDGVELAGKRVGIIGTGSTGMQMVPEIAPETGHLTVFQRTPNYSVKANNFPISDERDAEVKARYRERREAAHNSPSGLGFVPNKQSALDATPEERQETYDEAWDWLGFGFVLAYYDLILDERANETAADFIRDKIAEQVDNPETRETLMPRGFPFGAKRPSVDNGYFPTFNRDDVTLVDVRADPIERLTSSGVATAGAHHELEVLVFATGFDAMTGSLLRPEIVGRGGRTLAEHWSAGPRTYLGPFVAGFPNLLIVAGPGSPSLLSNVIVSIEQHVDWLARLLAHMRHRGRDVVEPAPDAESRWVEHVNARAQDTLYPQAQSYYMGDEVAGKPRVFMPYSGGVRGYRRILEQVEADGYDGLTLSGAAGAGGPGEAMERVR